MPGETQPRRFNHHQWAYLSRDFFCLPFWVYRRVCHCFVWSRPYSILPWSFFVLLRINVVSLSRKHLFCWCIPYLHLSRTARTKLWSLVYSTVPRRCHNARIAGWTPQDCMYAIRSMWTSCVPQEAEKTMLTINELQLSWSSIIGARSLWVDPVQVSSSQHQSCTSCVPVMVFREPFITRHPV